MFDVIIKNGNIIDGTGQSMAKNDIGIKEGKIAEIGDLENEKADKIIDAAGKYVAPGFIDVDNHRHALADFCQSEFGELDLSGNYDDHRWKLRIIFGAAA